MVDIIAIWFCSSAATTKGNSPLWLDVAAGSKDKPKMIQGGNKVVQKQYVHLVVPHLNIEILSTMFPPPVAEQQSCSPAEEGSIVVVLNVHATLHMIRPYNYFWLHNELIISFTIGVLKSPVKYTWRIQHPLMLMTYSLDPLSIKLWSSASSFNKSQDFSLQRFSFNDDMSTKGSPISYVHFQLLYNDL